MVSGSCPPPIAATKTTTTIQRFMLLYIHRIFQQGDVKMFKKNKNKKFILYFYLLEVAVVVQSRVV